MIFTRSHTSEMMMANAPALEIPNPKHPVDNVLTGGQPSAEQITAAAAAGFRTIVTLRPTKELGDRDEQAEVEAAGMTFVSIPIATPADLTEANARALADALSDDGAILVHCGSGNRVGALFALKAHVVDGVSPAEALAFGKQAGLTSLEPAVRQKLGL